MPRRFPTQLPLGVTDRADPRTPLQREARPPQLVLVVDPIVSAAVPAVDGERDSWITGQQFEADLLQWETDQESEQRSEFGTISDTELRAGRVHRCEGCNGQILIGDRHRKHTYRLDGDLKTERYCLSCTLNDSESSRRFDDSQCDYNGRNDFDPNAQTGQHWRK